MTKYYKIIIWHVLVAVLAWWMWLGGQSAKFNALTGIDFKIPALAAFILITAVLVLGYIVFQKRRWSLTATAVIGFFFMLFFGWNWLNLSAILIFLVFNLWSATRVRREIVERRILNIQDAFYHGLTPIVFGLFVMISFAAYQSSWADQIKKANQLPNQTQVFIQQIIDKFAGNKIQARTTGQRREVVNQVSSQVFQEFNSFLKPYFQYAPPVLAFGLFLILWGLSFVFIWLGMAVGMILYWITKKFRVVWVENKDMAAEVLVI